MTDVMLGLAVALERPCMIYLIYSDEKLKVHMGVLSLVIKAHVM